MRKTYSVEDLGSPCRNCGKPLVWKKRNRSKKKLTRSHYCQSLWCKSCRSIFLVGSMRRLPGEPCDCKKIDPANVERANRKRELRLARRERKKLRRKQRSKDKYARYLSSPHWQSVKNRIRAARKVCEACGSSRSLHVHHGTYAHKGSEWDEDVFLLCEPCHAEVHRRDGPKISNQLMAVTVSYIHERKLAR